MTHRTPLPSRRLGGIAAALALGLAAAGAAAQEYQQAPTLAEKVAAGELPPVAERLPAEPMVVTPREAVGRYGGTIRSMLKGPNDAYWMVKTMGYDPLVRWSMDGASVEPNIAESWEVSEDGTTFTFDLREGMRWSDGEPFTSADLMFFYEDVLQNQEIMPVPPSWLAPGGEMVEMSAPDEQTIVFEFAEPNGLFLQQLAAKSETLPEIPISAYPAHYLQEFHPAHNENVDQLVEEAGLTDWVQLFSLRADDFRNAGKPALYAWTLANDYGSAPRVTAERNPYYWKVDTEGQQLPYVDGWTYDIIENEEVMLLRALAGDVDLHARFINTISNKPAFYEHADAANIRIFDEVPTESNDVGIALNLTHEDPVKREIFNNKDFRIGLSHAIDREEIAEIVYLGQAEPYQVAPLPNTPFYSEEMAKQYTEYDVDLANEYLDKAGFAERDTQGYRLGPDGERISFVVETRPDWQPRMDVLELVRGYWNEVGIDMQIRPAEKSLFHTRAEGNQQDAGMWSGNNSGLDAYLEPRFLFPFSPNRATFAQRWAAWYESGGAQGEEPPEDVKRSMALYDEIRRTSDPDRQLELMRQIVEIAKDRFYVIGTVRLAPLPGIVSQDLKNTPDEVIYSGIFNEPGYTAPEQYFYDR